MYEFVLYSRKGQTNGEFRNMIGGGRLDIVYQCILTSIFKSHAHRQDVKFHAILNGPPAPPLHLEVSGEDLRDARTDERTWEGILRKVLGGGVHPGVKVRRESLQSMIRDRHDSDTGIFVLEEKGENVLDVDLGSSAVFLLGDQIGLPRNDERFALRFGRRLSLGRQRYLAASCIDILNYLLDSRSWSSEGKAR